MELNSTHYMDLNTNISFAGCGFIGIYHVGASVCLKKFAPHLLKNKIGGSSAGRVGSMVRLTTQCNSRELKK